MTAPVPRLAVRQELFCEEIAAGASAAEAVRRAGYSPLGVRQCGHFLHDLSGDSGSDPAPAVTDSDLAAGSGNDPAPAVTDSDLAAVSVSDPGPAVTDSDLAAGSGSDLAPAVTDDDLAAIPGNDPAPSVTPSGAPMASTPPGC